MMKIFPQIMKFVGVSTSARPANSLSYLGRSAHVPWLSLVQDMMTKGNKQQHLVVAMRIHYVQRRSVNMIELMNKAKELDIVLWNFIDKYIRLHKQGLLTTIEALDKIDSCLCIAHRDNRDIILLECHKKLLTNRKQCGKVQTS